MISVGQAGTVNITKIEQIKRQRIQEQENAELWYQSMVTDGRVSEAEEEGALLWYELMTGGVN